MVPARDFMPPPTAEVASLAFSPTAEPASPTEWATDDAASLARATIEGAAFSALCCRSISSALWMGLGPFSMIVLLFLRLGRRVEVMKGEKKADLEEYLAG